MDKTSITLAGLVNTIQLVDEKSFAAARRAAKLYEIRLTTGPENKLVKAQEYLDSLQEVNCLIFKLPASSAQEPVRTLSLSYDPGYAHDHSLKLRFVKEMVLNYALILAAQASSPATKPGLRDEIPAPLAFRPPPTAAP